MPIYLYRCDSCGQNHEALQKVGAPPLGECPACGAQGQMKKLIAPVGVIFKGSGFHKNDYTGGGGGGKKAEPAGDSGSGDKGSDKSDSPAKTESSPPSTSSSDGGSTSSAKSDKVA